MSPKSHLGKSFPEIMAQAGTGHDHPLISALAFIASTDKTGGATMNAVTGHVLEPHEPGYVVGAEPDTKGDRVPSGSFPAKQLTVANVLAERTRVREATGRRENANVGSWEARGRVITDASRTFPVQSEATLAALDRREEAGWNNTRMHDMPVNYGGFMDKRQRMAGEQGPEPRPNNPRPALKAVKQTEGPVDLGQYDKAQVSTSAPLIDRWNALSHNLGRDPRTLKKR
jgi:hypothetical protein